MNLQHFTKREFREDLIFENARSDCFGLEKFTPACAPEQSPGSRNDRTAFAVASVGDHPRMSCAPPSAKLLVPGTVRMLKAGN